MAMAEGLWGGLPVEIVERVLSFLPVPVLCRFRCVCRRWNMLVGKPSFQELCESNGTQENYLFVTRYVIYSDLCYVDPSFIRALSFLDLSSRRWYTIKTKEEMGLDTRLLAMDDGLLCDLAVKYDTLPGTPIVVFDPVARTRTTLRAPPSCCPTDALPIIVLVADSQTCSYRVFFVNNCVATSLTRIYVYESSTKEWRGLSNPSGVSAALSAVFFQGAIYVVFQTDAWNKYVVLRTQDDAWKPVNVTIPDKPSHPKLVVSNDRLFLMVWAFMGVTASSSPPCSHDVGVTASLSYEVIHILVAENASERVVQITTAHLQASFDEEFLDIAYGIPWFDSPGSCTSVILVSSMSGKLIKYDLVSGAVDVLPAHPLGDSSLDEVDHDGLPVYASYAAKHMPLSLQGLLSHGQSDSETGLYLFACLIP